MGIISELTADFIVLVELFIKFIYFTIHLWSQNLFVPSKYLYKIFDNEIALITGAGK